MKITFNDATELTVQSASTRPDGSLLIKTISDTEENLKTMFQDQTKTKKLVVKERESTLGEYENYTNMDEALSLLENAAVFVPIPDKLKDVLIQLRDKDTEEDTEGE